jgi:hypothetical protein
MCIITPRLLQKINVHEVSYYQRSAFDNLQNVYFKAIQVLFAPRGTSFSSSSLVADGLLPPSEVERWDVIELLSNSFHHCSLQQYVGVRSEFDFFSIARTPLALE